MRMQHVVADPCLTMGPYRILTRTDGKWILYDERLPIGNRTAAICSSRDAVVAAATQLIDRGAPPLALVAKPSALVSTSNDRSDRKRPQQSFPLSEMLSVGDVERRSSTKPRKKRSQA